MVIIALFFPGVFLYLLYSFLAPGIVKVITGNRRAYVVYAVNSPPEIRYLFEKAGIALEEAPPHGEGEITEAIIRGGGNYLLIFPPEFGRALAEYDVRTGAPAPNIVFFYNSLGDGFTAEYARITAVLNAYESSMANKFDINRGVNGDKADSANSGGRVLALMFPVLLLMFIFQGAMAVTIEAVTGEKERGTLAAILITSIKPGELAAGKLVSLGIESCLCGLSGTLGALLSLPGFFNGIAAGLAAQQGQAGAAVGVIDFSLYSFPDYCVLFTVILSTTYFIVTLVALFAVCARTTKEAQLLLIPIVIILMLVGILGAFYGSVERGFFYPIPVYNSIRNIASVFSRNYDIKDIILSACFNVLYTFLGGFILSKLFKSEKIIFPA
jgi:sodium transport system permease protein